MLHLFSFPTFKLFLVLLVTLKVAFLHNTQVRVSSSPNKDNIFIIVKSFWA